MKTRDIIQNPIKYLQDAGWKLREIGGWSDPRKQADLSISRLVNPCDICDMEKAIIIQATRDGLLTNDKD